ncbi:MAG: RtcB family protein [Desulfovibrio sp.]|nr:RtcB family protein [Desulfovibrio sp.]
MEELGCAKHVQLDRARQSLGTLGGGNHFIEVDFGEKYSIYLVIHSGSRHLGKEVCDWYTKQGYKNGIPYELTYIDGDLREQYLHDMRIVQEVAKANRREIIRTITKAMKWESVDQWESVHN